MSEADHEIPDELQPQFTWEDSEDDTPRPGWWRLVLATIVFGLIAGLLLGVGGMVMLAFR